VISEHTLDVTLLVLALVLAGGLLLTLGNGAAVLLERAAYGGRTRAARRALADAVRRGAAGPDTRQALARLSRGRALAVLEELAPSLAGGDARTIGQAADDLGLVGWAERRCRSRSWRRRVHAVRVLDRLDSGEAAVPPLLDDPRPEVRAAAAEWAAGHPAEPLAHKLVAMLGAPEPFTRASAMDSLIRLRRHAVPALAEAIAAPIAADTTAAPGADPTAVPAAAATGPATAGDGHAASAPRITAAALEVAARIADPELAAPAAARARDADPHVRAWVARLLGALGGEEHAATVTTLLDDPDAEVRAAAAIALGRLGHWPAVPALAARLRDRAWRVRRDSALALRGLGPPGGLMLERALRDEDPFARDMARQTLDLPESAIPS
jgi:HEAT repeat protein